MDAVKFMKEKKRMCNEHSACIGCPLSNSAYCVDAEPEELVEAVEAWSKGHPLKTNGMKVWELIPGDVRLTNSYPADENLLGTIKGNEYVELIIRKSWWDDEYKER